MTWCSEFEETQTNNLPPLSPALKEVAATLQRFLNDENINVIMTAYAMGNLVTNVFLKFGEHAPAALEQLADHLGLAPASLYRLRDMFCTYDREFIQTCRIRTTPGGHVISLGHLLELVRVRSAEAREELIEEFYATGMSVTELRERIAAIFVVHRVA